MTNKLIIANGDDADLIYALGCKLGSPAVVLIKNNKKIAIIPDLELKKAKKEAKKDVNMISFSDFYKENPKSKDIIIDLLKKYKIKKLIISPKSKASHYKKLIENNINVELKEISPERRTKTKEEIKKIREVAKITEKAMSRVAEILRKANSNNKKELVYQKKNNKEKIKVSSEFLKIEVEKIFTENNVFSNDIIISHGSQTSMPHDQGSGIIKENDFVLVDLFPRSKINGYFFDMTRTFCKKPSKEQLALYNAVLKVQKECISMVKPGIDAGKIHKHAEKKFKELGYKTKKDEGFIHALGHGVGLEIHELPRVGPSSYKLKENDVMTIEPGLYYSKLGGVRIEDTLLVTDKGYKNLTSFVKKLTP